MAACGCVCCWLWGICCCLLAANLGKRFLGFYSVPTARWPCQLTWLLFHCKGGREGGGDRGGGRGWGEGGRGRGGGRGVYSSDYNIMNTCVYLSAYLSAALIV